MGVSVVQYRCYGELFVRDETMVANETMVSRERNDTNEEDMSVYFMTEQREKQANALMTILSGNGWAAELEYDPRSNTYKFFGATETDMYKFKNMSPDEMVAKLTELTQTK